MEYKKIREILAVKEIIQATGVSAGTVKFWRLQNEIPEKYQDPVKHFIKGKIIVMEQML